MHLMPNLYQCVYCKQWVIDKQQKRCCHLSIEIIHFIAHTVIILKSNLKGRINLFQIPLISFSLLVIIYFVSSSLYVSCLGDLDS